VGEVLSWNVVHIHVGIKQLGFSDENSLVVGVLLYWRGVKPFDGSRLGVGKQSRASRG